MQRKNVLMLFLFKKVVQHDTRALAYACEDAITLHKQNLNLWETAIFPRIGYSKLIWETDCTVMKLDRKVNIFFQLDGFWNNGQKKSYRQSVIFTCTF